MDEFLANCMGVGIYSKLEFNEDIYRLGFEKKINDAEKIVIYGTGKIGKMMYEYLKYLEIEKKILCFASTENNSNECTIEGIKIKKIEEIDEKTDVLLLISEKNDFWKDMYEKAIKYGFTDIEKIDYELEKIIEKAINWNKM